MNGLRLVPGPGITLPPRPSTTFSYLFASLADDLRPLYWYAGAYPSTPFYEMTILDGQDDWFQRSLVPLPGCHGSANDPLLFRPGTLPDAGRYLYNDWVDLVGIAGDERRAAALALDLHDRARAHPPGDEYVGLIEREAACYFHCMDGRWWEVYAREGEWLARVLRHASGDPNVQVNGVTLREKVWEP